MSDLLSRLVDRATGVPPRVEPVLPSLYEPVGAIDPTRAFEQPATVEPEDVRVRPERNGARTVAHAGGPLRVTSTSPEPGQRALKPETPERNPARPVEIPEARPAQPSAVRVEVRQEQDDLDARNAQGRARPTVSGERAEAEPATSALSDATGVRANSAIQAESSLPVVQGKRARRSMPAGPPPAPVEVQVTIGHIEVRTAAPPPQVPQRRPSGPTVTLEDYLRRRNGAAR